MDNSLTSRPPGLLKLPADLLYQVFDDVYMYWSEVESTSRKSERPLTSPLSRALVDYQRQGLYRSVTVTKGTAMVQFFKAILSQPQLAIHTTSLAIKISSMRLRSTLEVLSPEVLKKCFSSFQNLRHLSLRDHTTILFPALLSILTSDTLSPKCTSLSLSLPSQRQDVLASLPLDLERCSLNIVSRQTAAIDAKEDTVARPPFSSLSSLTLSNLQVYDNRDSMWTDFIARCTKLRRITFTKFDDDRALEIGILHASRLQSITELNFVGSSFYDVDLGSILPRFSNLRQLYLAIEVSRYYSNPFFNALRRLPLEILTIGEAGSTARSSAWYSPFVPSLPLLEALVSPPNQHLTLRTLKLNCVDEIGTIGTRVSTVDLRFHSIDPETDTPVEDLFPDDWDVPNLPCDYSIEGLKALRLAGAKNGVRVEGRVFKLAKVREAYEEDAELLQEHWEDWKKEKEKRKKSKGKKGKKGRK